MKSVLILLSSLALTFQSAVGASTAGFTSNAANVALPHLIESIVFSDPTDLDGETYCIHNHYTSNVEEVTFTGGDKDDGSAAGEWTSTNGDSGTWYLNVGGITGGYTSSTGDPGTLAWNVEDCRWEWHQPVFPWHDGYLELKE